MKKILLALLISSMGYSQIFQNQNKNWVFGWKAHMIFDGTIGGGYTQNNITNPFFPDPNLITEEGIIIDGVAPIQPVSNFSGDFLFATATRKLMRINSTTQEIESFAQLSHFDGGETNSIIIPRPKNNHVFDVFKLSMFGLKFFTVTATNTNNIVINNTPTNLLDHLGNIIDYDTKSAKITSVKHKNGIDYWLIAQVRVGDFDFVYSYLITCNGVENSRPVSSFQLPFREGINGNPLYIPVEIRASHSVSDFNLIPNIVKLSTTYQTTMSGSNFDGVLSVDFNRTTGDFINLPPSNALINLIPFNGSDRSIQSIEFSSDNSLLFASTYNRIFQININTSQVTEISYLNPLPTSSAFYAPYELFLPEQEVSGVTALQKGPNGVIYVNAPFVKKIGRINNDSSFGNSSFSSEAQTLMPVQTHTTPTRTNIDSNWNAFTSVFLPQLVQQHPVYTAPTIVTDNDAINFNVCGSAIGQTSTSSVLEGDLINGSSSINLSTYALQQVGTVSPVPSTGGFTLNANGTINLLPNTPTGTYTLQYKLCENTNPACAVCSNVSSVTISVVNNSISTEFNVIKDAICAYNFGNSSVSVLNNDTVNGLMATGSSLISVTQISTTNSGVTIGANGLINIASGTPYGIYNVEYKICNLCDSSICSEISYAKVTFYPSIYADADVVISDESGVVINSTALISEPPAYNVLSDDLLNCNVMSASQVQITQLTSSPYFSINTLTGNVNVNPNTPMGEYVISYKICQIGNLTNCSQTTVTLVIGLTNGSRANGMVRASKILPNNKILIAGTFYSYSGINRAKIALLDNNLALNIPFGSGISSFGPNGSGIIHDIETNVANTNVYLVGQFSTFNNSIRSNFAVLNTITGVLQNITLNTMFSAPTGTAYKSIFGIAKHNNGSSDGFLIAGQFANSYHGPQRGLARINESGVVDLAFFDTGSKNINGIVTAVGVLPTDQSFLIGGDFTLCGSNSRGGIAKFNQNGTISSAFANVSFIGLPSGGNGSIPKNKIEKIYFHDNKIYVVGNFTSVVVGGVTYAKSGIVRFDTNGILDTSFGGVGTNECVKTATFSGTGTDTKIYIGGHFTKYNNITFFNEYTRHLIKLNNDGSFENVYASKRSVEAGSIHTSLTQPDGKILVGGGFMYFDDTHTNNITRFSPITLAQSKTADEPKEIKNSNDLVLSIYPNPFDSELNLNIDNYTNQNINYEVYDLLGKLILHGSFKQDNYKLNFENINSGNYLIRILTDDKEIFKKIIKK